MKRLILVTVTCACLSACNEDSVASDTKPVASNEQPQLKEPAVNTPSATETPVSMSGTVVYKEIEGGFYAFVSDKGEHFTLRRMPSEYHKNGLRVAITGKPRPDVMTFTQFGTVFEVDSVKVIDASKVKPIDSTH